MGMRFLLCIMFFFTGLITGCAGTSSSLTRSQTYKKDLGYCGREEFLNVLNKIVFMKYQYLEAGNMRDMPTRIQVQTEWRFRTPFTDEQELGIVAAESRIIAGAKLSAGETRWLSTGEANYYAYLQAENRVKYEAGGDWVPGPMTNSARRYFRDIAEEMTEIFTSPY